MDNANGHTSSNDQQKEPQHHRQQQQQQQRKGRKRKKTESDTNGEVDNVQRSAKKLRNSRTHPPPSPDAVSTGTSIKYNLPHGSVTTSAAPGLSMPSISSSVSSSVGSTSNPLPSDDTSDTQGSSDCFVGAIDLDIYALDSPATVSSSVLSPFGDENLTRGELHECIARANSTTHGFVRNRSKDDVLDGRFIGSRGETVDSGRIGGLPYSGPCQLTPACKPIYCPMPKMSWASSEDMWDLMYQKDGLSWIAREPQMFSEHPGLQPRMRSILLDWLNEVCEVYKLHRETYYLALDYIDRFISLKKELKKTHLQLLGITALFIAAKVEEIYPPKIAEFAYVTDGACTEEDILHEEQLIISALDWKINPVTVISWLGIYMQIHATTTRRDEQHDGHIRSVRPRDTIFSPKKHPKPVTDENADNNSLQPAAVGKKAPATTTTTTTTTKTDDAFVYPQFSGMEFAHTAQLIDLCSLDVGMANFKYSVIAAAALSHTFDRKMATSVSGLCWDEIAPCAKWMEPFFQVICEENAACPLTFLESNDPVKYNHGLKHVCPNMVADNSHIIQTHTTSLEMLDLVSIKIEQMEASARIGSHLEASPAPVGITDSEDGILTPPASNRKSLELVGGAITAVAASEAIANAVRVNGSDAAGAWSSS
uniref:Uncharacterized protein n=1 Tax=Anopheles farauti TaxID=69004 RepID=A0A182QNM1_9DIPT